MSGFLPPDASKSSHPAWTREEAFYELPASREELERAYVGTLMRLRSGNLLPKVKVPDDVFSPVRKDIIADLRLAWPYAGAREVADTVLLALEGHYPPHRAVNEFVCCIVQARTPDMLDMIAEKLLRIVEQGGGSASASIPPDDCPR